MTGNMQNGPASQGGIPAGAPNAQTPQPYPGQPGQNHPPQGQPQQFQQPYVQPRQAQQQAVPHGQTVTQRPFPRPDASSANPSPAPAQPDAKTPRSPRGKRNLIIAVVIVVVAVIVIGALVFANVSGNAFFDSSAQSGQASYKTPEEIEAERNRQMEEGMLNISIASVIEFENGTSPGTAFIENVPSNKYVLKVTITTDSNGEVVYQSGGIKPDSFIETITLSKPLAAGTYPATATFVAYNPDTLQEVGQANAKVTLVVKQ